jgi:hypothetical protein
VALPLVSAGKLPEAAGSLLQARRKSMPHRKREEAPLGATPARQQVHAESRGCNLSTQRLRVAATFCYSPFRATLVRPGATLPCRWRISSAREAGEPAAACATIIATAAFRAIPARDTRRAARDAGRTAASSPTATACPQRHRDQSCAWRHGFGRSRPWRRREGFGLADG